MKLFDKHISGPFTIPSGIVTTDTSIIQRIAHTVPEIGILTTKSISIAPKAGNREPVYARYSTSGSFVNAVGLSNPGAEVFAQKMKQYPLPRDKFLMVSVFGATAEDFFDAARVLVPFADAFELNISCPHAKGYGQAICQDSALVGSIIRKVKTLGKPVVVKISPNVNVRQTTDVCLENGADGFVAINTWGPKRVNKDGHAVLTNVYGGVSGTRIRDIGVGAVRLIRSMTDKPIIACGGITTAADIRRYEEAGAAYFGIGSSLTGMDTAGLTRYFHALHTDWKHGTTTSFKHLRKTYRMKYQKTAVAQVTMIDACHALVTFEAAMRMKPGQFVFVWIPGVGEKPFSVLDTEPGKIYVKVKGCFTEALVNLKKGEVVYWRGPYGKPASPKGRTLLIGAGTGIAALALFAKRMRRTYALLGAKHRALCLEQEMFASRCANTWMALSSEDGEPKRHVTDVLPEVLQTVDPDSVVICGPEQVVYDTVKMVREVLPEDRILSSVEFMTKCGVGICGSCATNKGLRNCVDGTFFLPDQLI